MRAILLLAMAMALVSSSSAQEPIGPRMEDGSFGEETCRPTECPSGDNDPRIAPEEIIAPAVDWDDPAWTPVYELHSGETGEGKGADSVSCSGRDACEDYKVAETAKSDTTVTEAER